MIIIIMIIIMIPQGHDIVTLSCHIAIIITQFIVCRFYMFYQRIDQTMTKPSLTRQNIIAYIISKSM